MIQKTFFNQVPVKLLLALDKRDQTTMQLTRTIKHTYCYIHSMLKTFKELNLVVTSANKNEHIYSLNKRGKDLAKSISAVWFQTS